MIDLINKKKMNLNLACLIMCGSILFYLKFLAHKSVSFSYSEISFKRKCSFINDSG